MARVVKLLIENKTTFILKIKYYKTIKTKHKIKKRNNKFYKIKLNINLI